ncbi:hypothetical protein K474DRAFT_1681011, partial [Panus rudis PR-1116 ss-1]
MAQPDEPTAVEPTISAPVGALQSPSDSVVDDDQGPSTVASNESYDPTSSSHTTTDADARQQVSAETRRAQLASMSMQYELCVASLDRSTLQKVVFTHPISVVPEVDYTPYDYLLVGARSNDQSHLRSLVAKNKHNRSFLDYERDMFSLYLLLLSAKGDFVNSDMHHEYTALCSKCIVALDDFDKLKHAERWRRAGNASHAAFAGSSQLHQLLWMPLTVRTEPLYSTSLDFTHQMSALIGASCVIALVSHLVFGMPVRGIRFLLHGLQDIIRLTLNYALEATGVETAPQMLAVWQRLPVTLQTVFTYFKLDPVTRLCILCEKCFALYFRDQAPDNCTARKAPAEAPCGASLFTMTQPYRTDPTQSNGTRKGKKRQSRRQSKVPVKPYLHQPLSEWIHRMVSRDDIRQMLITSHQSPNDGWTYDMLDGDELRNDEGWEGSAMHQNGMR